MHRDYKVKTSLLGMFQGENIACAIGAIEYLIDLGYDISIDHIKEGVLKTKHPGRMEIVCENPLIILDGAHNPSGINVLVDTLNSYFKDKKIILIFGVLSDKNVDDMLEKIIPASENIILTKSKNIRSMEPKNIFDKINEKKLKKVVIMEEVQKAVEHAKAIASSEHIICITGSLFLVGEARDLLVKT